MVIKLDMMILWLVPLAYTIHIFEEYPRFVSWTKQYTWLFSSRWDRKFFIDANIMYMAVILGLVALATLFPNTYTLILGLATATWIFTNFLLHAAPTLADGAYSPGVVTAGAIYVPVALYVYGSVITAGALTYPEIAASVVVGFVLMVWPLLNLMRLDRKDRAMAASKASTSLKQ